MTVLSPRATGHEVAITVTRSGDQPLSWRVSSFMLLHPRDTSGIDQACPCMDVGVMASILESATVDEIAANHIGLAPQRITAPVTLVYREDRRRWELIEEGSDTPDQVEVPEPSPHRRATPSGSAGMTPDTSVETGATQVAMLNAAADAFILGTAAAADDSDTTSAEWEAADLFVHSHRRVVVSDDTAHRLDLVWDAIGDPRTPQGTRTDPVWAWALRLTRPSGSTRATLILAGPDESEEHHGPYTGDDSWDDIRALVGLPLLRGHLQETVVAATHHQDAPMEVLS